MANMANPMRVQEVAERLQRYYGDDLYVTVQVVPRQGLFIRVTTPDNLAGGKLFHVDQLDNGAKGFRIEALAEINAFRDHQAYTPPVPKSGQLVFDDVMTYSGKKAPEIV